MRAPRAWPRLLAIAAGAVLAAGVTGALVIQEAPVERVPHFVEHSPAIIAHAGAQGYAPPNTLEAFALALELGADTLEMDLQLTADGQVVVHHDGTVDRQTQGNGAIIDMTLDELRGLDAGWGFAGPDEDFPYRGQGVRIPTLEEVFEAFPDTFMIIEMKTDGGPGIVPAVAGRVRAHGREDSVVVASFSQAFLEDFRDILPGVPTNMPEGETRDFYARHLFGLERWWSEPGELFHVPEHFEGRHVVTANFVAAADRRGIDVQVWTVNEPDEMRRLLGLGVHGIMTDYPDVLVEVIAEREGDETVAEHRGLGLSRWLQERLPWLTPVMRAVTFLGDEEFYVLVFPLLYWAVSRRVGFRVGVAVLVSVGLNEILKLGLRSPRPGFLEPALAQVHESTFGIPSGHAQNGVVMWGVLAAEVRRRWVWAVAIGLMILLGMSRLHLGAHFLEDTLAGWVIGALLLIVYLRYRDGIGDRMTSLPVRRQALAGMDVFLVMLGAGILTRLTLMGWELPPEWIGVSAPDWPVGLSPLITPAAALAGLIAGVVWQRSAGGFSVAGSWWQRALRCAVGLAGMVLLWQGLGELFPRGEDPVALAFRFLRYAAIGFWAGGVAPRLFVRLRLARGSAPQAAQPATR